jgi:hypothetical protein
VGGDRLAQHRKPSRLVADVGQQGPKVLVHQLPQGVAQLGNGRLNRHAQRDHLTRAVHQPLEHGGCAAAEDPAVSTRPLWGGPAADSGAAAMAAVDHPQSAQLVVGGGHGGAADDQRPGQRPLGGESLAWLQVADLYRTLQRPGQVAVQRPRRRHPVAEEVDELRYVPKTVHFWLHWTGPIMWLEIMILVDGAVHFQYWMSELDRSRADGRFTSPSGSS